MLTFDQLLKSSALVKRGFEFAREAHKNQKRKNGEPYLNHLIATAKNLIEWGLDESTVTAGLLHDTTEDTPTTLAQLKQNFGEEIAFLVDGVSKIGLVKYRGIESRVENMRKFILALSQDIRVVLIKLADRLHNMRTLEALPPQKQKRIALETMEIYAPLAYRLGMHRLSGELEDLAFPFIYPQEYRWLMDRVKEKYEEREKFAERLKPVLLDELAKNNINVIKIDSRAKRYTSLYKKLLKYEMNFDQVYDLMATRIIVPTVSDCYGALGVIHKAYPPLPKLFKDYIALPKPNGYQSLHTTVFGPENRITEVQIRTPEMHEQAEFGIAAHWAYQEHKNSKNYVRRGTASMAAAKELAWISQLREWQNNFTNPDEFMQSLKIDFFQDRILAITPSGEVIDLPAGSTPIDFGYAIHSAIGDTATGARVNGKIFPLNGELKSGDVCEIITQKNKLPSESWLEFVKTGTAKNHIRAALRQKENSLAKVVPTKTELKIITADTPGLINEISTIITRSHLHITGINSPHPESGGKLQLIKIHLPMIGKDKADKLVVKLKTLKEIKEIVYRFI
jgi:GTP pyrophosphokinase